MESIRKDVECTFGIIKGRFCILKAEIRLYGVETADKIWMTCSALHNWLLDVDGLDENWGIGLPTAWEGELGHLDQHYLDKHVTPFACCWLNNPSLGRRSGRYNTSGVGRGIDRMPIHNNFVANKIETHIGNDDEIGEVKEGTRNYSSTICL
jgi:Plant transposon protein